MGKIPKKTNLREKIEKIVMSNCVGTSYAVNTTKIKEQLLSLLRSEIGKKKKTYTTNMGRIPEGFDMYNQALEDIQEMLK